MRFGYKLGYFIFVYLVNKYQPKLLEKMAVVSGKF